MFEQKPIRVMLVDDHELILVGLASYLNGFSEVQLVGTAKNGVEALIVCDQIQPDVILMDLLLPEMNGVAATKAILQKHPHIRIIAVTNTTDNLLITQALQAGVSGFLQKDISGEQLIVAIRTALHGGSILSQRAMQAVVKVATSEMTSIQNLTTRELEVLTLMTKGLNNLELADRFSISRSTIKYYISSIFGKLGVTNRQEAITFALQHNLVHD